LSENTWTKFLKHALSDYEFQMTTMSNRLYINQRL